ncbi:MAG: hypothetical protein ACP6IU_06740 [Candidatus Asgardarchaeia archaeon]
MIIRGMLEEDLKSVIDLLVKQSPDGDLSSIKEHTIWHFHNFKKYCFVAEDEKKNKITGVLVLHPHENIGEYKNVLELEEFLALSKESKRLLLMKLMEISKHFENVLVETALLREITTFD